MLTRRRCLWATPFSIATIDGLIRYRISCARAASCVLNPAVTIRRMGFTMFRIVTDRARTVGVASAVGGLLCALRAYRRSVDRGRAQATRIDVQVAAARNDDGETLLHLRNHGDEPVRASALVGPVEIHTERSWRSAWLRLRVSLKVTNPVRTGRTLWPGDTDVMATPPLEQAPALYIADSGGRQWVRASSGELCEVHHVHGYRYGRGGPWMDQPRFFHPCAGG